MCGIAGIMSVAGKPVTADELHDMCAAMVHRGPNDEGIYHAGPVGLAMRRLSIIDLKTGHQPIRNEDGSVWVVLNGEIYNFRELRKESQSRGHAYYTTSDTEVIVHLYEDYGEKCVEKLRGMFSFALWDGKRQVLLLARDRLGIKPLYYSLSGGRLVFASELKAILPIDGIERNINWNAANHLFTFLTTPASESIIEGIHKLEPAHILTLSSEGRLRKEKYWAVTFKPDHGLTEEDCKERLRELLDESVKLHLESDVPVGAFLSGGIDSSSVVAMMMKHVREKVKTFSIGFEEEPFNEAGFARLVARELGTEHHETIVQPDVWQFIDELVWHLDEPFGDCSAIPTYMVSKAAAKHVKVVLSGDGGDELFAGYDKYVVEERERRRDSLPASLRMAPRAIAKLMPEGMRGKNFIRHLALSGLERYVDACALFRGEEKRKLLSMDVRKIVSCLEIERSEREAMGKQNGHWLSALQRRDLESYLPLDILTKVDRMSMAHSLEVRVPLLDHKVVEFAAAIPPELKLRNGVTKYIFKEAMRGILPAPIIDRPKKGFAVPVGHWFNGALDGIVREILLSDRCKQRGVFNTKYIERLQRLHRRRKDLDLKLWTLLSFELWCRKYLDQQPRRLTNAALDSPVRPAQR